MDWNTVVGFIAGGLVGGLAVYLRLGPQLRAEREKRQEDALRERREKGAAAVGPIRVLLRDSDPDSLMMLAGGSGTDEKWRQLVERWDALRDPLRAYASGHPSGDVGEVANQLAEAVGRTLSRTNWSIRAVEKGDPDFFEVRERAREDYAVAVALADKLTQLEREDSRARTA